MWPIAKLFQGWVPISISMSLVCSNELSCHYSWFQKDKRGYSSASSGGGSYNASPSVTVPNIPESTDPYSSGSSSSYSSAGSSGSSYESSHNTPSYSPAVDYNPAPAPAPSSYGSSSVSSYESSHAPSYPSPAPSSYGSSSSSSYESSHTPSYASPVPAPAPSSYGSSSGNSYASSHSPSYPAPSSYSPAPAPASYGGSSSGSSSYGSSSGSHGPSATSLAEQAANQASAAQNAQAGAAAQAAQQATAQLAAQASQAAQQAQAIVAAKQAQTAMVGLDFMNCLRKWFNFVWYFLRWKDYSSCTSGPVCRTSRSYIGQSSSIGIPGELRNQWRIFSIICLIWFFWRLFKAPKCKPFSSPSLSRISPRQLPTTPQREFATHSITNPARKKCLASKIVILILCLFPEISATSAVQAIQAVQAAQSQMASQVRYIWFHPISNSQNEDFYFEKTDFIPGSTECRTSRSEATSQSRWFGIRPTGR